MAANISIKILESNKQIESMIYHEIVKIIKPKMPKIAIGVDRRIKDLFRGLIENNFVVKSLQKGELYYQFGMKDITQRLEALIEQWISEISVKPNSIHVTSKGVTGGLTINMINRDYNKVYSMPQAEFLTPENHYVLPWLKWLLEMGSTPVVIGYGFKAGSGKGRTGGGVMVEGFNTKVWSVPSEYQGVTDNNFLTDITDWFDKDKGATVEAVIQHEFKKAGLI